MRLVRGHERYFGGIKRVVMSFGRRESSKFDGEVREEAGEDCF